MRQRCYTADHVEGDTINENEHTTARFFQTKMVGYGKLSSITCDLFSFESPTDRCPPLYEDEGNSHQELYNEPTIDCV